ncbi:tyrosine-type recombinase/integrase [Nakamurella sp. GG22]
MDHRPDHHPHPLRRHHRPLPARHHPQHQGPPDRRHHPRPDPPGEAHPAPDHPVSRLAHPGRRQDLPRHPPPGPGLRCRQRRELPTLPGAFALLSQRIDRGATPPSGRGTIGITKTQADQIITDLRADDRTRRTDLPDLLHFIAGTGCRTSEATALTWDQLDLDTTPATVLINATVNGVGQRQPHTKTRAGVRRLVLAPAVTDMLRTRQAQAKPDSQLVFPATRRRNTDRVETPYWTSNITGQIRTELDRLGHTGISGRSFRKMVATELAKHGYTPRQIADQLGHARPSVTLDIYQNRENTGPPTVLDVL